MTYPRFQQARAHVSKRRTSGNISIAGTVWTDVDTSLDLTTAAQVGDVLRVECNGMYNNEAQACYLDVVTVANGTIVGSFGASAAAPGSAPPPYGISAWGATASVLMPIGTAVRKTVVAADIYNGNVTVRLRGMTGSATARTIRSDGTNWFFEWSLQNLGPPDPH